MQKKGKGSLHPFVACRSGAAKDVEIVQLDPPAVAFLDDRHDPVTAFLERPQSLALGCAEFCSRHAQRIPKKEDGNDEAGEDKSPWRKQASYRNRTKTKVTGNDQ